MIRALATSPIRAINNVHAVSDGDFRIPYALMIGALVGVTALIPYADTFLATIIGAFVILTVDLLQDSGVHLFFCWLCSR